MTSPSAFAKAKSFGKRIIGQSEHPVPVVTVKDWTRNLTQNPARDALRYVQSLFPIFGWITRYNFGWLYGDVIAGLTVGIVVVPQSMSYAQIATLPTQYGLYSAFVGVLIYCLFATSKDVSIGPVAVMSLTVSHIIASVNEHHPGVWSGPQIATTVAFICGFIVLGIGILRLGWLVEFIPSPAVSGFMTGSAINIVAGQVPGLLGETGFKYVLRFLYTEAMFTSVVSTRDSTYKVIINCFKFLPATKLDAAFGITGLVSLYLIRFGCDYLGARYPRRKRLFFFISVFRNAFVIVILTIASWLYCRHHKSKSGKYPIRILQTVPRGFQHVGPPVIDKDLVSAIAGEIPVATIILLLEHIAISKSFGRLNGYKINPNQELIAIGVTNTVGTVFGAYPATGSFSRSALKSKSGVRTPAAGILTAVVVIVALYGLTPAFFWIPNAALSAVIIHAVADLVASPKQVFSFWRVSPLEFFIWAAAVLVTVFSSIENGIYTSICASLALLLVRLAHPRGYFLGKVTLSEQRNPSETREVYVPLKERPGVLSPIKVVPPSPGVIVYRFEESVLYPNTSLLNDALVDYVKKHTRRGIDMSQIRMSDRPWNDPGPKPGQDENAENLAKPALHAIVLDFSGVSHIDTTGVQSLIDTRTEVERWANKNVEFHFATVLSPWIRRGLIAGGFGIGSASSGIPTEIAPAADIEAVEESLQAEGSPIVSEDTPFFHFDLSAAVRAAEAGLGADRSERSSFIKSPDNAKTEASGRLTGVGNRALYLEIYLKIWSKIKQKKGASDIQKGALYSRAYRVRISAFVHAISKFQQAFQEIVLAVRNGGNPDPEQNNSLAAALRRAKDAGVPRDNIENALKKAVGGKDKGDTQLTFEVMGPGSVGLMVECLSDNPNRTIKELNNVLKDNGGRMADVKFLFKREGRVNVALDAGDDLEARLEKLVEVALDADAEDFETEDQDDGSRHVEFKCPQPSLHKLTSALSTPGIARELLSSELVYAPIEPLEDLDDETGEGLDKLVQAIEDADDTLRVWTTADA
uniref:Diguanylate cyclase n=1 Tax=Ganoderma boninense TaxID=34458 RepID=A0A5K1K170_9APHY|nr:Diguanylate cyclase [Ganoderma boninense]